MRTLATFEPKPMHASAARSAFNKLSIERQTLSDAPGGLETRRQVTVEAALAGACPGRSNRRSSGLVVQLVCTRVAASSAANLNLGVRVAHWHSDSDRKRQLLLVATTKARGSRAAPYRHCRRTGVTGRTCTCNRRPLGCSPHAKSTILKVPESTSLPLS